MQLSHLRIHFICVLSIIWRCGCVQEVVTNENNVEKCIVTRVCVLAEVGTAADCLEENFASKNLSLISLHLAPERCVLGKQGLVGIGWFLDQPLLQWIGKCWNKMYCGIQVESDASHVRVGILLGTKWRRYAFNSTSNCFIQLRYIPDTGQISRRLHLDGKDLGCSTNTSLNSSISINNTTGMPWVVPAVFYNQFKIYNSSRKKKRIKHSKKNALNREKKSIYGDDVLDDPLPKSFPLTKSDVKDIIFSDTSDSSDMFTGELTPDEQIWNADLPETVDPVMTFPDDYMYRIPAKGKKKGKNKLDTVEKSKHIPGNIRSQEKELPVENKPTESGTEALKGRDMLMALEETIENRLQSSLSGLMKDQKNKENEDMSLVSSLALENKVKNALSSVEKEPGSESNIQGESKLGQHSSIVNSIPFGDITSVSDNQLATLQKEHSPVHNVTLAKALPPPDETISSINKPRLPSAPGALNVSSVGPSTPSPAQTSTDTNFTKPKGRILTLYPQPASNPQPFFNQQSVTSQQLPYPLQSNATASHNAANSGNFASDMGVEPQSQLQVEQENSQSPPAAFQTSPDSTSAKGVLVLKDNIDLAKTVFNLKIQRLIRKLGQIMHVQYHPKRKRVLQLLSPEIKKSSQAAAWSMAKQVCEEPLQRMMEANAGWQHWTMWSSCTTSCGSTGYQVRRRFCAPEHVCSGSNFDLKPCNNQLPCLVSSSWMMWSPWGLCSTGCNAGENCNHFRVRSCLTENLDMKCDGHSTEVKNCSSPSACVLIGNENTTSIDTNTSNTEEEVHDNMNLTSSSTTTTTAPSIASTTPDRTNSSSATVSLSTPASVSIFTSTDKPTNSVPKYKPKKKKKKRPKKKKIKHKKKKIKYNKKNIKHKKNKSDIEDSGDADNPVKKKKPRSGDFRERNIHIGKQPRSGDFRRRNSHIRKQPRNGDFRERNIHIGKQPRSGDFRRNSHIGIQPRSGDFRERNIHIGKQPRSGDFRRNSHIGKQPRSGDFRERNIHIGKQPRSGDFRRNSHIGKQPRSGDFRERNRHIIKQPRSGDIRRMTSHKRKNQPRHDDVEELDSLKRLYTHSNDFGGFNNVKNVHARSNDVGKLNSKKPLAHSNDFAELSSLKKLHARSNDFGEVSSLKEIDSMVDELDGIQNRKAQSKKPELGPFQPLSPVSMVAQDWKHVPTTQPKLEDLVIEWSAWGFWSSCVVTCGKGTQFRKRECMRLMGDTFEGETIEASNCKGRNRERKYCAEGPCPLSVVIHMSLTEVEEGGDGQLKCQNKFREAAKGIYWITPGGDRVVVSTPKYSVLNDSLLIHNAQQSDLGEYVCILLGTRQRQQLHPPPQNYSKVSDLFSKTEQEAPMCKENPCENGGTCKPGLDMANMPEHLHGEVNFYHCLCADGFYGKHCEQKSLVHMYTPNLRIMGIVLMCLIAILFFTCTLICVCYWIQRKKYKDDLRPIMTRRRSEDQWRKMKSFDQKGRQSKKNFSPKEIKKRLSRMWTGKDEEGESSRLVRFGVEESPYNELMSSLANPDGALTEVTQEVFEKHREQSLTHNLGQPSQLEREVQRLLEDKSENASPPTVGSGSFRCKESSSGFGNTCGMNQPEASPALVYSDDQVEIFSSNAMIHVYDDDGKCTDVHSYSPSPSLSEESPKMHIFRSKHSKNKNDSSPRVSSTGSRHKLKQKRRSKKSPGISPSVEYEFNQNNSDESNEGNGERENQSQGEAAADSLARGAGFGGTSSDAAPSRDERGHQSVSRYSSTDSGEEPECSQQGASGIGARPKVRNDSKLKSGKSSWRKNRGSKTTQDYSLTVGGDTNSDEQMCAHGLPFRSSVPENTHQEKHGKTISCKAYEVYHPDEPYPYRLSRTRRRSRDVSEDFDAHRLVRMPERTVEDNTERWHNSIAGVREDCTTVTSQQRRPHHSTAQRLKHLEGGGEGASAALRNDSRKSGRDVLLRRAMENAFIRATTGRDVWRLPCPASEQLEAGCGHLDAVESELMSSAFAKAQHSLSDSRWSTSPLSCNSMDSPNSSLSTGNEGWNQSDVRWPQKQNIVDTARDSVTAVRLISENQDSPVQSDLDCSSATSISPSTHLKPRRIRSVLGTHSQRSNNHNAIKKDRWTEESPLRKVGTDSDDPANGVSQTAMCLHTSDSSMGLLDREHRSDREMLAQDESKRDGHNILRSFNSRQLYSYSDTSMVSHIGSKQRKSCRHNVNIQPVVSMNDDSSFSSISGNDNLFSIKSCCLSAENEEPANSVATPGGKKRHGGPVPGKSPVQAPLDSLHVLGMFAPKSALKQYSGLQRFRSANGKQRSLRRVSFSEPKVHIHRERISIHENDYGARKDDARASDRQFDNIMQRDGGPLLTEREFEHISRRPCGPLDLDTFSEALHTTVTLRQPQGQESGNAAHDGILNCSSAEVSEASSQHTDCPIQNLFSLSRHLQNHCVHGEDKEDDSEADRLSETIFKHNSHSLTSTTQQSQACSSQHTGHSAVPPDISSSASNDTAGQQLSSAPALLVDIEPQTSTSDLSSEHGLQPRKGVEEEPVSLRLFRQGLVSPLMPSPASDTGSGHGRYSQSSQASSLTDMHTAVEREEAGDGKQTAVQTSEQTCSLSFDSFQEMLTLRTPDAFFKPISEMMKSSPKDSNG